MELDKDGALIFPCDYPIKVFGRDLDSFEELVMGLFREHVPQEVPLLVSSRASEKGSYLSVSITFRAESRGQVEALVATLQAHPRILMLL